MSFRILATWSLNSSWRRFRFFRSRSIFLDLASSSFWEILRLFFSWYLLNISLKYINSSSACLNFPFISSSISILSRDWYPNSFIFSYRSFNKTLQLLRISLIDEVVSSNSDRFFLFSCVSESGLPPRERIMNSTLAYKVVSFSRDIFKL